jgi:DNA-binding response OmpR family regulator
MKNKDRELQYYSWIDTNKDNQRLDDIVDEAIKEVSKEEYQKNEVVSDGSKNKFYEIPSWVKDLDDLSEYLNLDPYEFNILKTLWIHKGKRHSGTNELREINKRLHYAEKSKEKYLRNEKDKE